MPEPAESAPAALPPMAAPRIHADPAPIQQALKDSGLVLVQTRSDVKSEMPPEPEFRPAKRERRPPPPDLPMVQVQTRQDNNPPA